MDPRTTLPLGRTALRIPRVGIGLRPIGDFPRERAEDARAVIRHAIDRGLPFFDTAPTYGYGESEGRLGEVVRERGHAGLVIATKVGHVPDPITMRRKATLVMRESLSSPRDAARGIARAGRLLYRKARRMPLGPQAIITHRYDADAVLRSVEASLDRLGTDHLDIVFIHDPDDDFEGALRGAWPALERLRAEGTIRAAGVAMNQAPMLARFAREADVDVLLVAGRYTLIDRSADEELLPLVAERGIGLLVAGVFHGGLLAHPRPGATFDYRPVSAAELARARRIDAVCARHGTSIRAAALAFPLRHPSVSSIVVGVTSAAQLDQALESLSAGVPGALWEELEANGYGSEPDPHD